MKASLRRREGEEPLVRAKIPLTLLGLPVSSGVTMGSSEELGLHISTLFTSGPSCRVTFMPNDPQTPFTLSVKAGAGSWGSPNSSAFVISAQVKLPATSHHPCVSFSIKPRAGDFSVCKSVKGVPLVREQHINRIQNGDESSKSVSVAELTKVFEREDEKMDVKVANGSRNGFVNGFDEEWRSPESRKSVGLNGTPRILKDWSLVSHNSLPLGQNISARIRWRVGIPGEFVETLASDPRGFFTRLSLPVLSLEKISLHGTEAEREARDGGAKKRLTSRSDERLVPPEWMEENEELNKVAAMCSSIRRQMQLVYRENQVLRSTMEEVKLNFNKRVAGGGVERSEMESFVPSAAPSSRQRESGGAGSRNEKVVPVPEEKNKVRTPAPTPSQKKEEQVKQEPAARKAPTVDAAQIAEELKKAIGSGR